VSFRLAVVVAAGATLILAAACSSPSPPAPHKTSPAEAICVAALGKVTVSGVETSIGEIRRWTVGPNQRPAKDACPGVPDSARGAWCWTGGSQGFVSYGVTATGQTFEFAEFHGMSSTPSGPPAVP
jgi:hypothetical protein